MIHLVADVELLEPFSARAIGVATKVARHDTRQPGLTWAPAGLKGHSLAVDLVRRSPAATRGRWWR